MSNIEALAVSKDLKNQLTNYKTNTTVSIDACFNICKKNIIKDFNLKKKGSLMYRSIQVILIISDF